jgi:hypothetical protein
LKDLLVGDPFPALERSASPIQRLSGLVRNLFFNGSLGKRASQRLDHNLQKALHSRKFVRGEQIEQGVSVAALLDRWITHVSTSPATN